MSPVTELVFKGTNRSAIRALEGIAEQSQKTTRTLKGDADEQSASFRKTRESSTALRDSMTGLLGMVGIGGVAFGLRDLKDSAVALQSNQAQLQAALRATGQEAGGTAEKLKTFAESLSTKGGFGTTENLQTLTAFVRETKSATQAQGMLVLATNIARARNMDLASAQGIVAKAYTGQVRGLQQLLGPMVAAREASVGLSVSHQREVSALQNQAQMMGRMGPIWLRQQEINDHITAQESALATMSDKRATAQQVLAAATQEFAGSTSTYSRQTQGQISNVENALHNLTEELGTSLLPAIDDTVHVAADLAEWMAKNKKVVLVTTLAVAGLTAAWGGLKVIQGIKTMVLDLGKAFGITGAAGEAAGEESALGAEAATIGWRTFMTTTVVGLVLVGLVELIEHWKEVEKVATEVWHGIEKVAVDVWHGIVAAAKFAFKEIKGVLNDLGYTGNGVMSYLNPFGLARHGLNAIGLAGGGVVPRYMAGGGPIGTDTVPAWLTPEEGVLSRQGMQMLGGENALAAINAGMTPGSGGGFSITPSPAYFRVDGRDLANAVIRYTLNRAARGPGSYTGGALVTGAPGMPV